jgi:hypothetical protein
MSATKPKYTRAQKVDELWRRGCLIWKLHATQRKMYEEITNMTAKRYVINSSRRLGKTFLMCVIALEEALKTPNMEIKFACVSQKMVRKIITPLMRQILADCPKDLRPKFRTIDGTFEFRNGSSITVCGTEQGQVDGLRGTSCDLAIIDEAGFVTDLEYALESVLIPQTLTRPNSRILLVSTPPISPDHAFVRYANDAMKKGAYSRFTIFDNPMLTEQQVAEYMEEAGGAESTTWRREYLAEFVVDADNAILPEADEALMNKIVVDITRPEFFIPITALDLGYLDYTGALLAYYHFPEGKIVIEDEILVNKATSATIVEMVLEKERSLWGDQKPKARPVDGNALAIADLNATHKFNCHAPDKSDLHANVNRVRLDLNSGTILIHPRCTHLINQMKFATWDKSRSRFSRSSEGGHWDLIAALIYLAKHIDRRTNPFPADHGYDPYNDFGYPRRHPNSKESIFLRMFRRNI